ncbi:hypothetical protein [Nonomuraea sp. SYSU D8015]|uniref:hypothetical protein n=1 Tax=Nonomuraea sp. SYSU D8015 TaxID=2593644 RepID=UPI0016614A8E|nr:hypothetical protein [Nonomuraea sp. SYSU D8015]
MWYPQQPPPHGYTYGYAYDHGNHLPPPKTGNLELILLLAIGLPMLVLAVGSAVFFVLTDRGTVTVRDTLGTETTDEAPTMRLDPGTSPPGSTPQQSPVQ